MNIRTEYGRDYIYMGYTIKDIATMNGIQMIKDEIHTMVLHQAMQHLPQLNAE
jgi:arginyl-tRNA--protein-N-Asp/Glu arginylyltransferase